MTTITIVKRDDGKFEGLGDKDKIAYHKFRGQQEDMEPGEMLFIEVHFPRDPITHRKHFAMLTAFFDAQEQFSDPEEFRYWIHVGAGHCEFVPGPDGRMVAIPKSIAWHKLEEPDFLAHRKKVAEFIRSDRFQRFLWPHLTPQQTYETVETIMEGFERTF